MEPADWVLQVCQARTRWFWPRWSPESQLTPIRLGRCQDGFSLSTNLRIQVASNTDPCYSKRPDASADLVRGLLSFSLILLCLSSDTRLEWLSCAKQRKSGGEVLDVVSLSKCVDAYL